LKEAMSLLVRGSEKVQTQTARIGKPMKVVIQIGFNDRSRSAAWVFRHRSSEQKLTRS
jgi:hypothetical protein